jgi:hypothetical protein
MRMHGIGALSSSGRPRVVSRVVGFVMVLALVVLALAPAAHADVGFVDGSFSGTSAPSGMKPQSKLWVADGVWWGVMFNSFTQRFEIYRRDASTERWSTTGTIVDGRRNVWTDAKWDGSHLFIVSHGASWTSTLDGIRVERYSYDSAAETWSLDSGYPLLNVGTTPGHNAPTGTEGAVLDEDTNGRVWITWTRDLKTWVTHSTTDTRTFVTPFVVPVPNADNVTTDDMSTLVAFDGHIGVLWSNEAVWCMCFAIHNDGDADTVWTYKPMLGPAANPADPEQELADDHMNLKAPNDGSGMVYASSKTSLDRMADPLLYFNVFDGSNWTRYRYATVADQTTRAQIALDLQHKQVYMFNSSPCCNGGIEYYKRSSLVPGRIGFPPGLGTPFIDNAANPNVNNISTTKQTVDASTGLVAIAGDDSTKTYLHNTIDLSKADTTPPDTTIDSGPTGTDNNPDAKFTFSSTETDSTYECSLDASAYATCSSPKTYVSVGDGSHTFRVRAIDAAGNADPTPASRTWTVENTATLTDIAPAADTYVTSGTPAGNFGTTTALYTDKASSTDPADKQSFFRFIVAGTRKIISAKVRTWVTDGSVAGPSIFLTSNTWTETGLTWNNKPAPIGTALDTRSTGAVAKGAYIDYDVSAAVIGNATYSFMTTTGSTDATAVASKENTAVNRPPLLELRVDPPPDTNIDSQPLAVSSSTSASFAFSSNETGSTFACQLDGGTYAPCASPISYGSLVDGGHTFSVKATDSAGLTDPTPATFAWTVDTVAPAAPTLVLTSASDTGASSSDGITADTSPTFTGTADAGGLVTLSAHGSQLGTTIANVAGDWTFASEDLPEGTYTVTATVQDRAGNYSSPSSGVVLVIDTTPPSAPAITGPAADVTTQSRDLTVSGTATSGVEVDVLDGTGTAATASADAVGAWSVRLTGLPDGPHVISAVTRDVAGNSSDRAAARTVTVDNVAPDTTITDSPPDPAGTTADFSFSSTESGSTFECSLDSAPFASCTSPQFYDSLANATHTFAVRAIDAAGNVDATPASHSWTINGSFPDRPVITSPASGSFAPSSTVTVSGTADPAVTVEVFDRTTAQGSTTSGGDGTWSLPVSGLADGTHAFAATATNAAGSSALSTPAVTVTVDTAAPDTSIDSGPNDPTNATSATFGFSSNETGASFECRTDGAPFTACTTPRTVSGLADGSHTFEVRASDPAGNTDPTPARWTWTIDTAAPDTSITSGPSGIVANPDASFAFAATETGSTFECRLDGGPYSTCTSPNGLSNLDPGTHSFQVRATDAAGNTDSTPASRTWQVQQTAFADGFETSVVPIGFASPWIRSVGGDGTAVVETDTVKTGTQAARLSETANTGSFAMLRYNLPSPHSDVTVDGDVRVEAEGPSGGNVPILRLFDATSVRQLSFYRQNASSDRLYVSYGTPTTTTTVTTGKLPLGTWKHFSVHIITGPAGAGTLAVKLDGTTIFGPVTNATLGTPGVSTVQLGNDTKKQPFQLVSDNVSVTEQ